MTQEQFDSRIKELQMWLVEAHAEVRHWFPDGFVFDPSAEGGEWLTGDCVTNDALRAIGGRIDDVLLIFTFLQRDLGLPEGVEPRYLAGLKAIGHKNI